MNTVARAADTALARAAFPLLVLALSLAPRPNAVAAPAPLPGLVAHWSFDEMVGRLTPDSSGQANDAIVVAATMVKGVSNTALQFDGRASSVRCAHSSSLGLTSALTIEAWIRLDSLGFSGYPAIVRKEGAYALRFADEGLAFILWFGGQARYLTADKADWVVDQWYHLVATYDGAEMRLYVDGAEDERSPQQQTGPFDAPMSDCWVGAVGSRYAFRGVIDEVRLFSRALTAEEVARSHQQGRDSIRAQADLVVEPRPVGERPVQFRKPRREINMVTDGFIWIDAEDFTDYGGWLLDTQFVHLMGSAYLIAAGIGNPVEDATVAVNIPRAGKYRLWVRARNWLKEHSPGQFAVIVNGARSQQVFGAADAEDWTWEPAGEFDLEAGETRIALRDLTGYYGRCDALILTADLAYTPPNALEDVRQERSRLTGLSLEPKLAGEFDVIVVGAGSAGGVAALAAARMGAKTALIQNRPVLGGNASRELGVPISGAASGHPNARESGIIEELGRVKARFGYPKMSEPFRLAAQEEGNLTVLLNQHVFAVEMAGDNRIAAVRAVDTLSNAITVYRGKMFLDCTGDGWVGYYAGAEYRLGRESRDELNESLAPEKPDEITMSGCLMGERALSYRAEDTGQPVEYTPPPWAPRFPSAEEFGRLPRGFTSGQWWLEHPGDIDDIWDAERSRDELIRITFGYWDYIKNVWPERERAANYALTYVPILEAKRESRRLVGDYILTQNDVQNATVFPDRISYGGWPLDVHHPEGIFSGTEGPFDCNPSVPIYTIPFRCLYSANIENLLFAGRDMSVTHIALGSVRVQGTLAALGQAAGAAAALCVQHDTTPRRLCSERIGELQQTLLKHDQYIPELRNEDPLDLARAARLTDSSEARFETFGQEQVRKDDIHPLNTSRAVMFPRGAQSRLAAVHLLLASDADQPLPVTLHLRQATDTGDFSSTDDLATSRATVPPGRESWVEFRLDCDLQAPYAWVWLEPSPGISWRLMSSAPLGSCRAWGTTEGWHVVKGQYYAFFTSPPIAIAADYSAANLASGVTRIVGTTPNVWASDPEQPLPQWVELSFDAPVRLNTVYLTFDTDMNARTHSVPLVPQCVRDYELSYHDGATWTTLAQVTGNFQRRRVHRFDTVTASRLRLTVQATNGDRSARVFEIRAYEE